MAVLSRGVELEAPNGLALATHGWGILRESHCAAGSTESKAKPNAMQPCYLEFNAVVLPAEFSEFGVDMLLQGVPLCFCVWRQETESRNQP